MLIRARNTNNRAGGLAPEGMRSDGKTNASVRRRVRCAQTFLRALIDYFATQSARSSAAGGIVIQQLTPRRRTATTSPRINRATEQL